MRSLYPSNKKSDRCGYIGCPADACPEVKRIANYISPVNGGYGAVRDVIEHLLKEHEKWEKAISGAYGIGV